MENLRTNEGEVFATVRRCVCSRKFSCEIAFQSMPSLNRVVIRPGINTHMTQEVERPASYHPALGGQAPSAPKWANRDLQLQAYIASLPLATPLKGSPTATPGSGKMYPPKPVGLTHQATESNVLATMQSLFSTPSSGACTPAQPQTLAAGFATHAQLLRAKLSPLVTEESAGLSRAMEKPMASSVPGTAFSIADNDRMPGATKLPFMGHVCTQFTSRAALHRTGI